MRKAIHKYCKMVKNVQTLGKYLEALCDFTPQGEESKRQVRTEIENLCSEIRHETAEIRRNIANYLKETEK